MFSVYRHLVEIKLTIQDEKIQCKQSRLNSLPP
jgi:hypothetical protein